ncbi:DNA polymerase III subunit [Neolewinella antarctica]|uniref:DNA polymerase-3 subunit delta n=1 Tax=Neolewinella antarctica TaxID=442734 RepID=A0ABX0XF80_9BACT|nr:hypothetical protein [Neolewinella antarctica]NJC27986.1 DNA polymerase-3 subunit delta' [Neolewinella antarctica]
MQFNELLHQPPALSQLRQMAAADRLPHANIILSPPGTGGLPAALAVANLLLCENRQGESGDTTCGTCKACRKTSKSVHPDLHFAFPTIGSKMVSDNFLPQWREALRDTPYQEANDWLQRIGAENKQGNISRDDCAAIIRKLNLKIFEGRYKIMVIWLPEYLGNEGNRLLKMIEEPPENTIFLLVSERIELILNTILSRCQLTKLSAPHATGMASGLRAQGIAPHQATAAARLADGNYNLALSLANSGAASHDDRLLDWIRTCYSGSASKLVAWTDAFAKIGRENQKHFLRYALHFWREFLLLSVVGEAREIRLPEKELSAAKKLLQLVPPESVGELSTIISECTEYVERNANPKILMLDAGIRIHQTLRGI